MSAPPPKKLRELCQRRSGGRVPWAILREERAQTYARGPASVDELKEWPSALARALCGDSQDVEMMLRLETNLNRGTVWYTDYSGVDCVREAARLGLEGLKRQYGWDFSNGPDPLLFIRTCDKDRNKNELCCEASRVLDGGKACHFGDLISRLPQWAQDYTAASTPEEDASVNDKRAAHAAYNKWIQDNRLLLYPPQAKCYCKVHEKMCQVLPTFDRNSQGVHQSAGCVSHIEQLSSAPPSSRIRINAAGVTCVGWSSEGHGAGTGHASEVPHAVWLGERKVAMENGFEDVAFVECTPRYPASDKLGSALGKDALIIEVMTGPEYMGWPVKRKRVLCAVLCARTVEWMGPPTAELIQQDFDRRFGRSVALTGEDLFQASVDERHNEYAVLARKARNQVSKEDVPRLLNTGEMLGLMLPPGALDRMDEWLRRREEFRVCRVGIVPFVHAAKSLLF